MAVQVRNDELVDLLLPDFLSRLDEIINARIIRALTAAGLRIEDDGGNLGVFVDDGGDVGIRHDAPVAALDVRSDTNEVLRLATESATGSPFLSFYQDATRRGWIEWSNAASLLSMTNEFGDIRFLTGPSGTPVHRMMIDGDGNVGIGGQTVNPSYLLDVLFPAGSGNIFRAGQIGVSNGFIITTDGSRLSYSMGTGTLLLKDGSNISPSASGDGQFKIAGSGYTGYIALDGTAMYIGNNSSGRNLVLQTNETDKLTVGQDYVEVNRKLVLDVGATLTIASGVITPTHSLHRIDTQGGAATDDLDTINGGIDGQLLVLGTVASARDVVVKHNTGNILLGGGADVTIANSNQRMLLICQSNVWRDFI